MTSQLVIFRAFLFVFFRPLDPRSEKRSRKSTNEKNLALGSIRIYILARNHMHADIVINDLLKKFKQKYKS